jgi:hypothetical protein
MRNRSLITFACVAGLAFAPAVARADDKPAAPLIQVRLKSLDRTIDDLKYFLTLSGQKDAARQLEEMPKAALPNGFEGIDTKKPWALYGLLKADQQASPVVVMIPVTSEESFVKLLGNVPGIAPTKDGASYLIQPPGVPFPVHLQFANGYAYAAVRMDRNAPEKADLLAPATIFAQPIKGGADLQFRIDQIPDQFKQLALASMEVQLANQEEKKAGEDEATYKGRVAGAKGAGELMKAIITDGGTVSLDLDISREQEKFALGLGLSAKKGTELARRIGALGTGTSLFASWAKPVAAASLVVHGPLGEGAQKIIEVALTDGISKTAKQDKAKAAMMEKLSTALMPTVKSGVFDLGFDWRGPSSAGHYTIVGGMRLVDGDKIESAVKEAVASLSEKERADVKLDATSIGEFKVHKLNLAHNFDKGGKQLLGDNPVYVAFRKDAMFVVLGENGLATLGEALQSSGGTAPLASGHVNLKSLVPLMKDEPRAEGFAKAAFTKAGDDAITMKAQGGDALTLHFEVKGPVLKFLGAMGNKK